jgi:hypothetical protein
MLLGLATAAIVLAVLVGELAGPKLRAGLGRAGVRARERLFFLDGHERTPDLDYDPGRERRAELRAVALLRSCVNEEEWAMYRDLGFLRVWGHSAARVDVTAAKGQRQAKAQSGAGIEHGAATPPRSEPALGSERGAKMEVQAPRYAYLIYPHKPIVAYRPQTGTMLSEYCVTFPDHSRPYGSARLPDSDDVLAKWMALTADEHRLIADANMHLPGRQVDPERVRRDLARLGRWERERDRNQGGAGEGGGDPDAVREAAREAQDGPRVGQGRLGAGNVRAA